LPDGALEDVLRAAGFRVEPRTAEDDVRFVAAVVREREADDAREPPFAGVRFVVAVAPLRVFLGAMSP